MFTGIIEEIGIIKKVIAKGNLKQIFIQSKNVRKAIKIGSSVATNGVCLTVVAIKWEGFVVEAVLQTLNSTTLKELKPGAKVNLEAALSLRGRVDGHLVSGHVDTVGIISKIKNNGEQVEFYINIPAEYMSLVILRGSICIDGVSLTIAELNQNIVKVVIIPHTFSNTILAQKQVNQSVNIEFDLLGKYVAQQLSQPLDANQTQLEDKISEYSRFVYRGSLN